MKQGKITESNTKAPSNDIEEFASERSSNIKKMGKDRELNDLRLTLQDRVQAYGYSYLWSWLGIPVIQTPEDLILLAEIIHKIRPTLVIETGFARGGSAVYMQTLMDTYTDASTYIAVDIDVREHNLENLKEKVPNILKKLHIIEGDSTSPSTKSQIDTIIKNESRNGPRLVHLDSNHTADHVRKEIELYDQYLAVGDCLIVGDTVIEELSQNWQGERPWGKGDNPTTALIDNQTILKKSQKLNGLTTILQQ